MNIDARTFKRDQESLARKQREERERTRNARFAQTKRDSGVNPVGGSISRAYQEFGAYWWPAGFTWEQFLDAKVEDGRMSTAQRDAWLTQPPREPKDRERRERNA